MAKIKFSEINSFVANLYEQTNLSSLVASHASVVRAWFVANMTKIGRYSHRDFERFGNLTPSNGQQGRQDGWVSMTEEVSDPDHISYGTGILYVHGELNLPEGSPIENDCFSNQNPGGGTTDLIEDFITGEVTETYSNVDLGTYPEKLLIEADPAAVGGEDAYPEGFVNNFGKTNPPNGGRMNYAMIYQSVSGIRHKNHVAYGPVPYILADYKARVRPTATNTTPSVFNDSDGYELDNERNNYPLIIINSAQPESINNMLVSHINNKNGMYDDALPALNELPANSGGMKVSAAGREMILAHISPLKAGT